MESRTAQETISVERAVSLAEAESRARRAIDDLGLSPVLTERGETGDGPSVWTCSLMKAEDPHTSVALGHGKGNRVEARVGALFEALEHLLTRSAYFDPNEVYLCPARQVTDSALAADSSAAILSSAPEQKLACWKYNSVFSGEKIDVPLYLSSPWYVEAPAQATRDNVGDSFDYRKVAGYSTNSGCAIGVTANEAAVHAVNEVIERDALSLFLIRSFIAKGQPPFLVATDSLPLPLETLRSTVEDQIGAQVHLIDITTEVDVPAYLAYVPPTADRPRLYGAGASLSPQYAAYRALSELLQAHFLTARLLSMSDHLAQFESFRKYPLLHRCGLFDLTKQLSGARPVTFKDRFIPNGPDAHLTELLQKLQSTGFSLYQRQIRSLAEGITVVHVLIPGMERFVGTLQGVLATPGQRGIRAAHKQF